MKTKSIVFTIALISGSIKSQNLFRYYVEGQACSGAFSKSLAGGMGGAFGFYLSNNSSVDLRAREIYSLNNSTIIGAITINYRYHFSNGFFAGIGFGHHHELGEKEYVSDPMHAALGSHKEIFHRSGLAAEIGYNFKPFTSKGFFSRTWPSASIIATHMIMDNGYNPLITANFGLKIGLVKS